MLHYYHNHHAVTATSASDLSWSESWTTSGGTGGSSYINSSKYVREQQQQKQESTASSAEALERMIVRLASENAVVIFSNTTCCMCHAVKSLLCGMGVNPTVYEIDQLVDPTFAKHIERALLSLILANYQQQPPANSITGVAPVPVVFIGGKLLGPTDRVMASHINGTLVPLLKQAGALWL